MTWLFLWTVLTQADRVMAVTDMSMQVAVSHVLSAHAASEATPGGPSADVLLGIARVESGYDPRWVSRLTADNKRVTGIVGSRVKPEGAHGPYYCGLLQLEAYTWEQCLFWRDNLDVSYYAAARHVAEWLATPQCAKREQESRLICALQGYNTGWAGLNGTSYAKKVLSH